MPDPAPLPVGDIGFYDNDVPGIAGGNYWISVSHELKDNGAAVNTEPLGAAQEFVVSAPQFTLPPADIVSQHPPDTTSGRYGEQLPHIVLREPALPWERRMTDVRDPWLALLVFTEDELMADATSTTRANTSSVQDFLAPNATVFKPRITREDDVDPASPCSHIRISTQTFAAIAPRLDELRFLAHCRQGNISDKAVQNLDPNGFFSIVVANRFPARPAEGAAARKNIAHLVSMEGLDSLLVDNPDFGGCTSVALLSLASWSFQCLPDHAEDFRGLVKALVTSEMEGAAYDPGKLWLRLQPPAASSDPAHQQARERLTAGFVPLPYHTRTGEETFAWYRGPLAPVMPAPIAKSGPFLTADQAVVFHKEWGVFDLSLATAWNAGRTAALADKAFGQKLFDFRRRAHQVTDQLLHRLQSKYFFSQDQIASLEHDTAVHDEFLSVLDTDLLAAIGGTPTADPTPVQPRTASTTDPKAAVQEFLADPAVQAKIVALVKDDLDAIAQWLARLLLLYPVPFNLLVCDERMLPAESLRFFYLDNNWTSALLDGALAIGLDSSRQTFFHGVTHGLLQDAAQDAARIYRQSLFGTTPPAAEENIGVISGMLLRSSLVSGWPNLAVRPCLKSGGMLKTLRMDHLSPSVLLCLFWGVPDWVEISEPQEGFRFGVDDDGDVTLRNIVAPARAGDPPVGHQIGDPLKVFDPSGAQLLFVRAADNRVLNLSPNANDGLVQSIAAALHTASNGEVGELGPATFALQMVKAPEAVKFTSQSS